MEVDSAAREKPDDDPIMAVLVAEEVKLKRRKERKRLHNLTTEDLVDLSECSESSWDSGSDEQA